LLRQLAEGVVAELVAAADGAALTRREADIALRLSKPGNGSFLARRIATVQYAVFARRGANPDRLPWIGFDETVGEAPGARWMGGYEEEPTWARAAALQTIYRAVRAGAGRGLLPLALAKRDSTLVAVPTPEAPSRELWLLVERRVRQVRRVAL